MRIYGNVEGKVTSDRCELKQQTRVVGDMKTRSLAMEEGAHLLLSLIHISGGSGHPQERHGGRHRHHAGNAHLAHLFGGGRGKAAQCEVLLLPDVARISRCV